MTELTLTRPDDWHVHLRDGDALADTCRDMARYFGRAIVMPNLTPPVTTVAEAASYRQRIIAAMSILPRRFEPLMTLYLTDRTTADEVRRAADSDFVHAIKLYPAGATTNSAAGVADLAGLYPTLEVMQDCGLPLLIHGEVTDTAIDIFDREKVFIERHLQPISKHFPGLKIVFEHITTTDAVAFIREAPTNIAATITAHHLLLNRNDMLVGAIRPHYFCLPVLKRSTHQQALLAAATSGNHRFFLGTDSAPHARHKKESACGCAGVYSAHAAIEFYAEAFQAMNALDKLEGFASHFGPDFYGLPRNTDTINLRKNSWQVADEQDLGGDSLTPLRAGELLAWQVSTEQYQG
ncbi:MAG: dihydroorotase [Parahaliea sp.]